MHNEMRSNHSDCTVGNFQGEESDFTVARHPEKSLHIYTTALKLCKIGMWLGGEKEKHNSVCSSNQKGHKNRGLLLKSMDYIIEWNAPSPVYGSQASRWLFPASVARVVRVHARAAGFSSQLC